MHKTKAGVHKMQAIDNRSENKKDSKNRKKITISLTVLAVSTLWAIAIFYIFTNYNINFYQILR